jgi:hypothetical protein
LARSAEATSVATTAAWEPLFLPSHGKSRFHWPLPLVLELAFPLPVAVAVSTAVAVAVTVVVELPVLCCYFFLGLIVLVALVRPTLGVWLFDIWRPAAW